MPVDVNVLVVPLLSSSGKAICAIKPRNPTTSDHVNGGVITLPPLPGDYYNLKFKLKNNPKVDIKDWFANSKNTFRSKKGSCPVGSVWEDTTVSNNPVDLTTKMLVVRVDGQAAGTPPSEIHYGLSFKDGNTPVASEVICDPIIINGFPPPGGGGPGGRGPGGGGGPP